MNIKDFVLGYLIGKGDGGGGSSVDIEPLSVTENGEYSEEGVAYSPVNVNVAGGGGGLEFETGTWTPSEDIAKYTISFQNEHTKPPFFYGIVDASGENPVTGSNVYLYVVDNSQFGGAPKSGASGTAKEYGVAYEGYLSGTQIGTNARRFNAKADSGEPTSDQNVRYWVKEDSILVYCGSDSCYWRSNRTYRWIAVFAPES